MRRLRYNQLVALPKRKPLGRDKERGAAFCTAPLFSSRFLLCLLLELCFFLYIYRNDALEFLAIFARGSRVSVTSGVCVAAATPPTAWRGEKGGRGV